MMLESHFRILIHVSGMQVEKCSDYRFLLHCPTGETFKESKPVQHVVECRKNPSADLP